MHWPYIVYLREHQPRTPMIDQRASANRGAGDILVIDDEVDITDFVSELLTDEGYSIRVAHNGASALLEITSRRPALLLLDVAMPVMSGDELLRFLRSHQFADLPVVMMTAGLRPEIFLAQGATDVLPKPFDLSALLWVVEHHYPKQNTVILPPPERT